jgi:hypothetical protein
LANLANLVSKPPGTDQVDAIFEGTGIQLLSDGFLIELGPDGRNQGLCRRVNDVGIYAVLTIGTNHDRSSPAQPGGRGPLGTPRMRRPFSLAGIFPVARHERGATAGNHVRADE